jgi:hypothetical protein
MEWTQENVIEFIERYKRKEIIWTQSTLCILTKLKKTRCMGELGKELNRPIDECKKKMQNVLSSLRLEKMKMRKSREQEKLSTSD